MRRHFLLILILLAASLCGRAQQVMYANLKGLLEGKGDTVTTLRVEKRTKNLINLMGGADYRVSVDENAGMSRYLKSRCYAVRVDSALYVNCRKMRYGRYRFGNWYAPAMWVKGRIYFRAQPLGQVASSTTLPADATKLGGEIGNAIHASGMTDARVYYELDPETGKSDFVGKERMHRLLQGRPDLQEELAREKSEEACVIGRYLLMLQQ